MGSAKHFHRYTQTFSLDFFYEATLRSNKNRTWLHLIQEWITTCNRIMTRSFVIMFLPIPLLWPGSVLLYNKNCFPQEAPFLFWLPKNVNACEKFISITVVQMFAWCLDVSLLFCQTTHSTTSWEGIYNTNEIIEYRTSFYMYLLKPLNLTHIVNFPSWTLY